MGDYLETEVIKNENEMNETELREALREARRINKEKSEFLARMSHEIRTPMNAIIGLTYLSKEHPEAPKQVCENLDKIDKSAHFLLDFINDTLNLSNLESGNIAINKDQTDMDEFLGELNRQISKMASEKKILYVPSVHGNLGQSYFFDKDKVNHALKNVLSNAVKFTASEGSVMFVTEVVREDDKEVILRFEITDNGSGMEKDFVKKAFDAFEQENEQTTTLSGGTGLGLTIAKNIVELMNGTIDLQSEKGTGTTVTITLPFEKGQEKAVVSAEKEKTLDYDFTGKRALIVEDNAVNIEIAKNILAYKHFETEVAVNGQECIDALKNHEEGYYDVILMDIIMPVMDGLTATKIIRNLDRKDCKEMPIIAMTANAFEADLRKTVEAGMDGFLSKPIDIKKMYSLLDRVIFK